MRIALCDDEQRYIDHIEGLLKEYRTPEGQTLTVDIFHNALDLITAMKTTEYAALLLDVIMPGFSGMDAARDIRVKDMRTPIVFLTTSPEFAVESYRVHAFDYLMKPVGSADLFRTMDHLYALWRGKKTDCLSISSSKGVRNISFNQLEYLEITKRTLSFHLLEGSVYEVSGKLSDYEEVLLKRSEFLKVHRSFIINMNHMKMYDKKSFTAITGEEIPISRVIAKEVCSSYMNYLHEAIHR